MKITTTVCVLLA